MPLIGASDATMCKIFPATLGGDARRWYSQLRNGIINNFTEFSTLFRCKFYAQKRQSVSINQLMNTKQREGEALKAYYARYNTLAIGVTSLSVEVIVNTLTRGTTNSLLRASLIKKSPRSMFELQERVMKYIGLEEALQDSSYVVPKRRRDSPPPNRETLQRPRPTLDNIPKAQKDDRRRDGPFPPGQNFTPLNNPRRNVLQVIQDKKLPVTWPPRGRIKPIKGKNQFCDFHRGYGHDTEECEKLGRSIEGLIQNGQLKQFIQSSKGSIQQPSSSDKGKAPQGSGPVLGVVPVIHGGTGLRQELSTSRKTYARTLVGSTSTISDQNPIIFDSRDLEDIEYPHDNPLVIEATIANYTVKRVLIDEGAQPTYFFTPLFAHWVFVWIGVNLPVSFF
ncbi:unnamed protein product [Linum trigynum]|uniref:Retrotransposon gag domain-containing protein n=1 Tax=Linum trigynum TaxID=586398 RepID=A0AAV2E618_9ROSI